MNNIYKLLESKTYDFLRTNEHLKDKILFLCLGGSHSYGTNIETSDIDIRGVALPTISDLLGFTNFEQFQDKETDTVIYSLPKFITLVSNCNPNVIEMLFCKEEHYFYVSPLGKKLLENRHLFLTKRAIYTFGGYAHAQLNRLENALVRNGESLTNKESQEHINRSVLNCIASFEQKYNTENMKIKTYVDSLNYGEEEQILCDFELSRYPLSKLRSMVEEMTNVQRTFNQTVGQRNKKKDDLHLNKHMMHLIRLYLMCNEILSTGDLHTCRDKEHELLMSIRNGDYRTETGGVSKEFYTLLETLEKDCEENAKTSILPKRIDKNKIEELLLEIYKQTIFKE